MKNEIKVIKEQEVLNKNFRIYGDIENPLFLAKDVAEWIDYAKVNGKYKIAQMTATVVDDEKGVYNVATLGGVQKMRFLTEDGLYEVLMQSRKPIAKQFKSEVKKILKGLRLTGGAVVAGREEEFITNYLTSFSDEVKLAMVQDLRKNNILLKEKIANQEPLVKFADAVSNSNNCIDIATMAKIYSQEKVSIGRNRLFYLLKEKEILMANNLPYQTYINRGYFTVIDAIKNGILFQKTLVTGKGQIFLVKLLDKEFQV